MQGSAAGIAISLTLSSWSRGGDERATAPVVTNARVFGWWSAGAAWDVTMKSPAAANVPLIDGAAPQPDAKKSGRWSVDPSAGLSWTLAESDDPWTVTPDAPNKADLTDVWIVFEYTVPVAA